MLPVSARGEGHWHGTADLTEEWRCEQIFSHGALLLLPQQSKVRAMRRDVPCAFQNKIQFIVNAATRFCFFHLCARRHCCGSVCCGFGMLLLSAGIVLALSAALAVTALVYQSVLVLREFALRSWDNLSYPV